MTKQITTIIGSILGGLIGSIPFILCFSYGNFVCLPLTLFIPLGILKGYQIFNGQKIQKLSWPLFIILLISVTFSTLIIIPNLLLLNEYHLLSLNNFLILYNSKLFIKSIIFISILSYLFSALGLIICFKFKKNFIKIILIIFLIISSLTIAFFLPNPSLIIRPISYDINKIYQEEKYSLAGDNGWTYVLKDDIDNEKGMIFVFYYDDENIEKDNTPKLMDDIFKKEDGYLTSKIFTNKYKHQVLYVEYELEDYYEYYYYIFTTKRYAFVEGRISKNVNNKNLKKDLREIANSLTWN